MAMKKRGVSKLILISSVALLIILAAFLYIYIGKEKVELTPEEQQTVKPEQKTLELTPEELEKATAIGLTQEEAKTAKSLELKPEEFNKTYTKAYEAFIEGAQMFEGWERSEIQKTIGYSEISLEEAKHYGNLEGLEIKPDSKIILVKFAPISPSIYNLYLIENGEIILLIDGTKSEGLS